jgi:hypothetical protein
MLAVIAVTIEKKLQSFLWSGKEKGKKLCNVSWSTITLPKSADGLRIGSLRDKNKSLLFKWLWRFGLEESSMRKDVIKRICNLKCFRLIPQNTISRVGSTWLRTVNHYVKDNRLQDIVNHQSVVLDGSDKRIKF